MAFYYVKFGGTATGDAGRATTARTGSYATMGVTAYYNSVSTALAATTVPVAGDSIFISDQSTGTPYASNTTLASGVTGDGVLLLISCDDTAVENALAGSSEGLSVVDQDLGLSGNWSIWGHSWVITDNFQLTAAPNSNIILQNGSLLFDTNTDVIEIGNDGNSLILVDATADAAFFLTNAAFVRWFGGNLTTVTSLVTGLGTNGGFAFYAKGVDLSVASGFLLENVGGSVGDDGLFMQFDGCDLNASVTFVEENFIYQNQEFLITHSSSSSTASEHQYYYKSYRGEVEDNTTTTRAASIAFPDSNQKISLKIDSDASCDRLTPFVFEIPTAFVELSVASTDTLQFFCTSATSLTDADIWAEVQYPDGTNKNVYNAASGALQLAGSHTIDPLGTGTTLATDSSWTSPLTNQQTFKVTTSGDIGADSIPIVRIYIAIASETIHLDPVFNAVAS